MKDEIWATMTDFADHFGIRPQRQWEMAKDAGVVIVKGRKKTSTGPVHGYEDEADFYATAEQAGWHKRKVDGKLVLVKDSCIKELPKW